MAQKKKNFPGTWYRKLAKGHKKYINKEVQIASNIILPRSAFNMYDKDGSGDIELEEMADIFCLIYTMKVFLVVVLYELNAWYIYMTYVLN